MGRGRPDHPAAAICRSPRADREALPAPHARCMLELRPWSTIMAAFIRLVVSGFLLIAAGAAQAQTRPTVAQTGGGAKSFLFVGNSFFYYNNSMHSVFLRFVREADSANAAQYRATSATISGSGLNWHDMEAYLKPGGGMASYSFVGDNEVEFNTFDRPFDVVIMNDCSQCPIHPKLAGLFHDYVRKHGDTAKRFGAAPVLFMTWAYADKPDMTQLLAEQYVRAGNDNGMLVIPAGLAFAKALQRKPDLALYASDKRHPSPAGTYLGAATAYASLFRRSPERMPVSMPGVDAETATLLRAVAWETVTDFHGSGAPTR
jgi:hypothetical protein